MLCLECHLLERDVRAVIHHDIKQLLPVPFLFRNCNSLLQVLIKHHRFALTVIVTLRVEIHWSDCECWTLYYAFLHDVFADDELSVVFVFLVTAMVMVSSLLGAPLVIVVTLSSFLCPYSNALSHKIIFIFEADSSKVLS